MSKEILDPRACGNLKLGHGKFFSKVIDMRCATPIATEVI